jgi:hypothetical protein
MHFCNLFDTSALPACWILQILQAAAAATNVLRNVVERMASAQLPSQCWVIGAECIGCCIVQGEVCAASNLVDQLQAALREAKAANSNSSAELVAGLQAELERQAGVIGELRTQLRASTESQEDLRRQTVSLVEAQAHMAAQQSRIEEGPPAAVARMQAQLLEKVSSILFVAAFIFFLFFFCYVLMQGLSFFSATFALLLLPLPLC